MLEQIEDYIKNLNFYTNVRVLESDEYPKYGNHIFSLVLEGNVLIDDKNVTIQIALDEHFPLHKPLFFLKPYNTLGLIPHVDNNGYICYVQDEGLIINIEDPLGIIEESFIRVIKTLIDGKNKLNHNDFLREFVDYWRNLKNVEIIESNVELTNKVKVVKVVKFEKYYNYFVGDNVQDIMNYCYKYVGKEKFGKYSFLDALYVPLREGTFLKPPDYDNFWTVKQFRNIIFSNITSSNKRILKNFIKRKVNHDDEVVVLVSIPHSDGNKSLIGVKYSQFIPIETKRNLKGLGEFSHPLYETTSKCKFVPLNVIRHDEGYIKPRGGGSISLKNKKILLVGCGSVGGYIAIELVKAGVKNISLIDSDYISQENVYRHVLGIDSLLYRNNNDEVYRNQKIIGIKKEIERKFPYTNINNLAFEPIEDIIKKNTVNFKEYNLIIIAIGNPTIELYLNKFFHENENMPPVIFTWLEAYGIGGHALLTNNNGKSGCLNCLYTDPQNGEFTLYNRASFAESGQIFTKQVSGCSSIYMPYGSLDSLQTAILATRLAIDVLNEKEKDNPILSWKGNADIFLSKGYKLSCRYNIPFDQLYNTRYLYKSKFCKVCGHIKDD